MYILLQHIPCGSAGLLLEYVLFSGGMLSQKRVSAIRIAMVLTDRRLNHKIKDKIFSPFYTTKPTGPGTGLSWSLSYDIVMAHGGKLKVETKEGTGSKFIIQLAISTSQ